jgi:hypothetical protein
VVRPIGLAVGLLALVGWAVPVASDDSIRISGHTHSVIPSAGILVLSVLGAHGVEELIRIHVRHATVVRLWRESASAPMWREETTSLYRLPINTFVTVIGHRKHGGPIHATRIEAPETYLAR